MAIIKRNKKQEEKPLPQVGSLLPSAFGPASWYGTPEGLIPLYTSVRWKKDEKLAPGETVPPLDLEEEQVSPSPSLEQ